MIFFKKIKPIAAASILFLFLVTCGEKTSTSTNAKASAKINAPTKKASNEVFKPAADSDPKIKIAGEDMKVKSGEEFCMNIKAHNFTNIVSMQYSTNWDEKALEYKGVKNFQIKDLTKKQFGKPATEPNSVRLAWITMDLQPVTLYNDALLYQICFKAKGKSGSTTQVDFTDKPLSIEFGQKVGSQFIEAQSEMQKATITIE